MIESPIYFTHSRARLLSLIQYTPPPQSMLAVIPLALLDSLICWWVFSALVATTRTLRLRRNPTKLSLYRHFTNVLAAAVVASMAFMVWSIK